MKTNVFDKIDGKKLKVAIVQARFNKPVTDGLKDGAIKALKKAGVSEKNIKIYEVPGSFEIPIICQNLARTKEFDGLIALGAVIKGDTAHFEYVSDGAAEGIMRVMLDEKTPIAFGVIMTYDEAQAAARSKDDERNKGYEAAMALIETIGVLKDVK